VRVLDVRRRALEQGLSTELLDEIGANLARGEQTVLFLNRRGYAPILMCHDCGWMAECARCDAHLVYHRIADRLRCHHCASERPSDRSCPACGASALYPHGVGTQRIAAVLAARFPAARIARLDRDATRSKGALERLLADVRARRTDILIGTQILAKGHHFPHVTLAGIVDADGGLVGADFRASERMAQLIVQVAGRAGRGERAGRVIIQTHHPDHPLLRALISKGYEEFARAALEERKAARLPPITALALVRAEAYQRESGFDFLNKAAAAAQGLLSSELSLLGPVPAPMERRAGRYRAQLLVEANTRRALHRFLGSWIPILEGMKIARRVRWSLDVDPQDML
jgi:primosomal protein N' (replication factor Y)